MYSFEIYFEYIVSLGTYSIEITGFGKSMRKIQIFQKKKKSEICIPRGEQIKIIPEEVIEKPKCRFFLGHPVV